MLMAGMFYWVRVRLTAEQLLPHALRAYLRQQADLDVQIERIQLSWMRVQAWNLHVRLPDGTPLGEARYLALAWQERPFRQIQIHLERPHLLLLRDRHGRWNIEPFLKRPPRRAAVQIPLELLSTEGILELRDEFVRPQVVRIARLHHLQIRQPGSSMVMAAQGEVSGAGQVQLHALSDGERWRLNLAVQRLRWTTVAPYLSERVASGEWRIANSEWHLAQGESALQLDLFYAPHQPLRIAGTAQGVLRGLRYRQAHLPWRIIHFKTQFTESLLDIRLHTPDGRLQASGAITRAGKGEGLHYALTLQASGNDASRIEQLALANRPASTRREREIRVAGNYALQIQAAGRWTPRQGWRNLVAQASVAGHLQLAQLHTPEGVLRQLNLPFLLIKGQLLLRDAQADFAGGALRMNAAVNLREDTPHFLLTAHARDVRLERIPSLREQQLSGSVDLQLLGDGTFQKPRLTANLLSDELLYNGSRLGALRARLIYQQDTLHIPVALLHGALGSVQVAGSLQSPLTKRSSPLAVRFSADELDLNRLASVLGYQEGILGYWEQEAGRNRALRLDGIAYLRGELSGTLEKPLLRAYANVFNGRLGDIGVELFAMQAVFQEGRLLLPELTLYRRSAVAHASGEIELGEPTPHAERGDKRREIRFRLQGNLSDFDLATVAEWSESPIKLAGLANLSFTADGTPNQFEITGELTTNKALLDRLTVDSTSSQFHLRRSEDTTELLFDSAQVQLREGTVLGQARLTLSGEGTHLHAQWNARAVPLQVLAPYLPADYRLQGVLDAEGQVQGPLDALQAEAKWQLAQLNLNEVALGNAAGTAQWTPEPPSSAGVEKRGQQISLAGRLTLQAQLDAPEGSIQIDSLQYAPESGAIEAAGTVEGVPLAWVRQLALALPLELPPDVGERTATLDGTLTTNWQLAGTTAQPQVTFEGRAVRLAWNGQNLGELQAQGNWSKEQLGFQIDWQAESTRLQARGTLQSDTLNAEMELSRFPLEWIQLWEPSLPPLKGNLDLTLLAMGNPDQPELTLSATVQNLALPMPASQAELSSGADTPDQKGTEFVIDQLLFSRVDVREGAISTEDALIQVRGYHARLSGQLPFRWSPISIPRDEPLSVQIALRDQPLRLFELFLPIDAERTQGTLNAQLTVGGTLNELQPRGELQITNGSLAFEQISTYLQELGLQVAFDGQRARILQAQARASAGGRLTVTGEVDVAREEPVLALTGTLERFTINEPRLPIGGSALGRASGEFALQGTLKKPQLTARLQVREGFLSLPAEMKTTPSGFVPPLNPELDVQVQLARGFVLRNPNLDARMEGALQITGSLRELRASGTFSLQGGALNLPTARLRLEPESLILLTYPYATLTGETIARLELNVRATTTVVALDYTGDPQRYRVELDIRGPLDDPERFQMVARSDPPGLSEQRILSLLGRGSVLEALARGGDPVQIFRQQLSEMVTGQVLPGLFAPIEADIAEALGLEQFRLDYTGVAPASIYLVKELFDNFGMSYRRSLATANPPYEVRFFYRLPFRNRFLQRLKLGWGFDNTQRQFLFIEGSLLFR